MFVSRLVRRMSGLLPALLLAAPLAASHGSASANLTWEEARARSALVSDVDYDLHLELRAKSPGYRGVTTVRFDLSAVGPLFLDFQGETVERLVVNGTHVREPRHEKDRLHLPEKALQVGRNTVVVSYENDYDKDGAGLHKVVDPSDGAEYLYTQFEPFDANRMFPCFDQPDLKASYTTEVKAPPTWKVITNGAETSRSLGGLRKFARTKRFSPYIVALAAGPYEVFVDETSRIPSRVYTTRSMAKYADPEGIFEVTRQGMDFFEEYFEIDYPFGKYDQVFVPQFNWGAMENVGCVIFSGDRFLYRHDPTEAELERRANVILHEMAHMWFGDIVTMEWWNDIWLNESFATYMAHLAQARATRFTRSWESFFRRTKAWAYWQDQLPTTHPIETEVPDTRTTFKNFDGITYGKGASTLKQLAFFVGEDAFRNGVAAYLKKHAYGNATRADFIASLAEASGLDLDEWTRLWLQRSGVNTITPKLIRDRRGRVARLELHQGEGNGAAVLRPHRLVVALYELRKGKLRVRQEIPVTVRGRVTTVHEIAGQRPPAFLHANHGDHAFAKVFLDDRSLAFARENMDAMPSAMLRSVIWQTAWFMVRDGAMSPVDYLELFLSEGASETDPKVVSSLLENAQRSLDSYLPDGLRAGYLPRVRQLAWKALRAAPAGSDLQKIWFRAAVFTSERRIDGLRLSRLLAGTDVIEGLELDQEKRWRLVRQLCSLGHRGAEELLAKEARRDATERGQRAAMRARASLPDPEVKAEMWEKFTSDTKANLALLKEGMKGFWWHHQRDLLGEYAARFFEDLPGVAASRGHYFAESFVWNLYPETVISSETHQRAKRFLSLEDESIQAVHRSVAEATDELRRALSIRDAIRDEE